MAFQNAFGFSRMARRLKHRRPLRMRSYDVLLGRLNMLEKEQKVFTHMSLELTEKNIPLLKTFIPARTGQGK